MAVYERSYRPYTDALTPERFRFLVIPRYAFRDIFAKRLFIAFFCMCFVLPLILAVMIYLPHNASVLKLLAAQTGASPQGLFGFRFNEVFFLNGFLLPQGWAALFLAFVIGPELISSDLRNNALPLYLSRPFSRTEFVLGKMSVMLILMSAITWVPGMLLFGLQSYLAGFEWFRSYSRIGVAIFAGSWIYILLLCLISLALSAYVKWKPLARLGLFGVFVVASGLSGVLNLLLETSWAGLLNASEMVHTVWSGLFGIAPISAVPPWAAAISLAVFCGVCILLLGRKIRAYEITS